ncbi:sigma-54-dependent Fis family transcriptional regulator [bacterium]|nr:sigma-54-dependent Fis family transcriptional regulator [bacterium]
MSEALSPIFLKERVLFLNESGVVPDTYPQGHSDSSLRLSSWPLLRVHEWSNKDPSTVKAVFINLDDIAATKPLDEWAIKAWKATFNEFVQKCVDRESRAPELVGYTRVSSWETAVLGMRIGVRDIVKFSRLDKKIQKLKREPVPNNFGSNIVEFPSLSEHEEKRRKSRVKIPHHAIPFPIDGLEGNSTAIENVRNIIRRSAPLSTSIMITGKTGTGKELVAKAIHRHSHRANQPFVIINCAAIAKDLAESELFGHVKGAFTGADRDRIGLLESAHGGTIFFDEITALDKSIQVKLLRVLQEKKIVPVGSAEERELDLRVVSSTKEDINMFQDGGKFRQDLIYRLRVIEIQLPSLSERRSDIPELCENILKRLARKDKKPVPELASDALEKLLLYSWPGNIRELENTLDHAATLTISENRRRIHLSDLPVSIQTATLKVKPDMTLKDAVKKYERDYIARTIERLGGNKEEAAELLGLSLATLYRKLGNIS